MRSCCRGSSRQLCRCKPSRSRRMSATGSGTCSPKRPASDDPLGPGLRSTRWPQTKNAGTLCRRELRLHPVPRRQRPENLRRYPRIAAGGFKRKEIVLFSDGKRIEELIPAPLRSKADRSRKRFVTKSPEPLVTRADRPYRPTAGLDGRHIALMQSHGYYFEPKLNRWRCAGTYFRDRRRPLHAELRAALPGSDAGKRPGPTS